MSTNTQQHEELTGVFGRVMWQAQSLDDGPRFLIATLEDGTSVKGEADPDSLVPGVPYRFYGKWGKKSAKFGQPFEFKQYVQQAPHSRFGVVQYLIKYAAGIGPVYAAQLWDAYSFDAVKMVRTDPDLVHRTCPQIPRSRLFDASEALRELAATEDVRIELTQLFDSRGFQQEKLIDLLIRKWGIHAPRRVRRDPFSLLVGRFPSCGFMRCDRLYTDLGLPPDRAKRLLMCIWRAFQESREGHTWHPMSLCRQVVLQSISGIPSDRVDWQRAVKLGLRSGWLQHCKDEQGQHWVAVGKHAADESSLAGHILRIATAKPKLNWPDPDAIDGLTDHQKATLKKCFAAGSLAILGGTPGTGKTTTAAAVIRELVKTVGPESICVCAPTGKAAVRIGIGIERNGVTGVPAATFHRTLGVTRNGHDGEGWGFWFNAQRQMPWRVYVIDEASMPDCNISEKFFQAIPTGSLVLVVGDPYQLPPVEHGAPLRDMIAAGLPYGELTEVLRNDGDVIKACRDIKAGRYAKPSGPCDRSRGWNWKQIDAKSPAFATSILSKLVASAVQFELEPGRLIDPHWDLQIITALNDSGPLSRKKISEVLRNVLNPNGISVDGCPFRVGDKVICTKNCILRLYGGDQADELSGGLDDSEEEPSDSDFVANGEIGMVHEVSPRHMIVEFREPARSVNVPRSKRESDGASGGSFSNFELGYAITFHKSQGSQWPVVMLLTDRSANQLGSRELWYTGLSRMESLVVTIGDLAVMNRQCKRVALKERKTFLSERLTEVLNHETSADVVEG